MIAIPEALLLTNFILEKGKERNYTYYFGECSKSIISVVAPKQFMKDEIQTSVLGLCGQVATGEVHDNPRGEIQSNPYAEGRGGIGAFITAQEQHFPEQWTGRSTPRSTEGAPLPLHPVVQQNCSLHSCQKTTLELGFSFALKPHLLRSISACK